MIGIPSIRPNVCWIYHNIRCPHRPGGPQRVSAAAGPFPAPFPVQNREKHLC